jgi:serine phosphatase RsbU (regulator of sigma subunit)
MKYIFVLIALLFSTSMWGQTPSDSARIARTQDSLRVIAAERHPKLFEKLVEVEQEIEAAVAKREEIRKEAEAATEPEAYSDVAKMSIKISKL